MRLAAIGATALLFVVSFVSFVAGHTVGTPPDDPPSAATVLGGWERGVTCIAPVRLRGGAVVAVELDPRRCAATAPGDVVTVLRRGERWLVR